MEQKEQNETPLYATLLYGVRKQLNISINEYFYLDMVHKLSYQRWCSKSLESCAEDMGITRRGLINLKNRMIERELIEKNVRGHVRVTPKYIRVAVKKVHPASEQSSLIEVAVNKVHPASEQSSLIENNKENLIVPKGTSRNSDAIRRVYNRFIEKFGKNPNQYKLSDARKKKLKVRLNDAGEEMLLQAVDNLSESEFHRGDNDRGWEADLDFLIKSYEQVEKWAAENVKEVTYDAGW